MANILLIQRTDRKDKYDKSNIRIRVIAHRKVFYYPTGVSVTKDQWNGSEVINHPNKSTLNKTLRDKINDFEKKYLEAALTDNVFNPKKTTRVDFHSYWQGKKNSRYKKACLNKLQTFKPTLYFTDLNPQFMAAYENYCRSKGNQENTVWNAVKFVKSTVNAALKDGTIKINPLAGYTGIRYVNPVRDYLPEDEINLIETFALDESKNKTLRIVADWFLFCCYSFLRYSDCVKFSKENIKDGKIILRTQKTGTDVSIKIHPRLQKVLDRLSLKIFSNFRCNTYLKLIGKDIKLKKDLHWHLSRHSASVLFLTKGGSMETLSKLLAHSDLRTTMVYGKISDKKIDDEIDKVFGPSTSPTK